MRAIAFLQATLTGNAPFMAATPGGVWRGVGPAENVPVQYPICVLQFQAGSDVYGANQRRLWVDGLYIVKITGPSDAGAALVTSADLADAALQDTSGSAQGGTIMVCLRQKPFGPLDEISAGARFTTVGGVYMILAHN